MHVKISLQDFFFLPAIGAVSFFAAGSVVGWGMWIAFGAFALGRFSGWLNSFSDR